MFKPSMDDERRANGINVGGRYGLSAVAVEEGIRVYVKTNTSMIREICHNVSTAGLQEALAYSNRNILQPKEKDWFLGGLRLRCFADSHICALAAWSTHPAWDISVFFQEDKHTIRERHYYDDRWSQAGFSQSHCLPGTSIAGVCSKTKHRMALFFQDDEEFLCFRQCRQGQWDDVIRLEEAAPQTGIAVTSWDDAKTIYVYWQDNQHTIRELVVHFKQAAVELGSLAVGTRDIRRAIAAVSWGPSVQGQQLEERRLYYHGAKSHIIEMRYSAGAWNRSDFTCDEASDLVQLDAFVRTNDTADRACINLKWLSANETVSQRTCIYHAQSHSQKWHGMSKIVQLSNEDQRDSSSESASIAPSIDLETLWRKFREIISTVEGLRSRDQAIPLVDTNSSSRHAMV